MAPKSPFNELTAGSLREIARAIQVAERISIEENRMAELTKEMRDSNAMPAVNDKISEISFANNYNHGDLWITLASKNELLSDYVKYGGVASRNEATTSALRAYIALVEDAYAGDTQALEALVAARIAIQPDIVALNERLSMDGPIGQQMRNLYEQEGEKLRRAASVRPSIAALETMDQHLSDMFYGKRSRYTEVERSEYARCAVMALRSGPQEVMSRENMLARNIANALASIDGPDADNPFLGTPLERIYKTAQKWQTFVQQRQDKPTLQELLNRRAVLIDRVEATATAMHHAQHEEMKLFALQAAVSKAHPQYQAAADNAKEAVQVYSEALRTLRDFRHQPTNDPQMLKIFQEVEALELVVLKTEQGLRDQQDAGIEPSANDWADLRNVKISLQAWLQMNDATLPMRNEMSQKAHRLDDTQRIEPAARTSPRG